MSIIWTWLSKHWSSVGMGLLLCWLSIGVTYVTFLKPSIRTGTYIQASDGFNPTFGCASGRQFFGWAHKPTR